MRLRTTLAMTVLGMIASVTMAQSNGGTLPSTQGDNIAGGGKEGNMTVDQNAGGAGNAATGVEMNASAVEPSATSTSANVPMCSSRIHDNCMEAPRHHRGRTRS